MTKMMKASLFSFLIILTAANLVRKIHKCIWDNLKISLILQAGGAKGKGGGSKGIGSILGSGGLLVPALGAIGISQSGSSPASPEHGYQGGRNNWAGSPDYGVYEPRRYPANPRNSGIRALADMKMSFMALAAILYKLAWSQEMEKYKKRKIDHFFYFLMIYYNPISLNGIFWEVSYKSRQIAILDR